MLGRIAAAMMKAEKRSARTRRIFQSASATTMIEPATSVATAALRAVSFIVVDSPAPSIFQRQKGLGEHTFARYNVLLDGSRRARSPRRPGAQPEGHHRPAPAERTDLHHRPLRV